MAGISSGGTSVLALLTNSEAKQTFQRVWISGASSKFAGSKADAYEDNKVYLRLALTRLLLLLKKNW